MKAKIICRTLIDIRKRVLELCKEYGVEADWVFLPETFGRTNNMGIAYAIQGRNKKNKVVAASLYCRMDDGLFELHSDLIKANQLVCTAIPQKETDNME